MEVNKQNKKNWKIREPGRSTQKQMNGQTERFMSPHLIRQLRTT